MTLADVLQFLHVVSAFMFVTGIVGRDIVLGHARRADEVEKARDLVEIAGVAMARWWEVGTTAAVLLLMVTKPF